MSSVQIATLFLAAVAAGAINSVAGGGSFISFPALLLAGVPPGEGKHARAGVRSIPPNVHTSRTHATSLP